MRAIRICTTDALRKAGTELDHLIGESARTWARRDLEPKAKQHVREMLQGIIAAPAVCLVGLYTDPGEPGGMVLKGFAWAVADVEHGRLHLMTWYIKHNELEAGFPLLFNEVDRYCYAAGLKEMLFAVPGPLPTNNPRYAAYMRRFRPETVFRAQLEEQGYGDKSAGNTAGDGKRAEEGDDEASGESFDPSGNGGSSNKEITLGT